VELNSGPRAARSPLASGAAPSRVSGMEALTPGLLDACSKEQELWTQIADVEWSLRGQLEEWQQEHAALSRRPDACDARYLDALCTARDALLQTEQAMRRATSALVDGFDGRVSRKPSVWELTPSASPTASQAVSPRTHAGGHAGSPDGDWQGLQLSRFTQSGRSPRRKLPASMRRTSSTSSLASEVTGQVRRAMLENIWTEFDEAQPPNFFKDVQVAEDGGFSEVSGLWHELRWITAIFAVLRVLANLACLVVNDVEIVSRGLGQTSGPSALLDPHGLLLSSFLVEDRRQTLPPLPSQCLRATLLAGFPLPLPL